MTPISYLSVGHFDFGKTSVEPILLDFLLWSHFNGALGLEEDLQNEKSNLKYIL